MADPLWSNIVGGVAFGILMVIVVGTVLAVVAACLYGRK